MADPLSVTSKSRLINLFVAICFSLAIVLSVFIQFTGGNESRFISLKYLTMIIPAIAVAVMTYKFNAPASQLDWKKFPVAWLLPALFLMPLTIHAVCLPLDALLNNNRLPWQSWLTPGPDGLYHTPPLRGWGDLSLAGLIFRIFINAMLGLITVSILAFFEEIAWRVWLLPRLAEKFNLRKGLLISAVIFAVWHIPYDLSDINYLQGVRVAWKLFFLFGHFGAGIVIGWFWLKTKSIWIICLAHGALNNWGQFAFKFLKNLPAYSSGSFWLLIGLNGSLFLLGVIVLATFRTRSQLLTVGQGEM